MKPENALAFYFQSNYKEKISELYNRHFLTKKQQTFTAIRQQLINHTLNCSEVNL